MIEKAAYIQQVSQKVKELVISPAILPSPNPQLSKTWLAKCLEDIVNTFYESDGISRTMPGKKDLSP
jgi:hypothetical protein